MLPLDLSGVVINTGNNIVDINSNRPRNSPINTRIRIDTDYLRYMGWRTQSYVPRHN